LRVRRRTLRGKQKISILNTTLNEVKAGAEAQVLDAVEQESPCLIKWRWRSFVHLRRMKDDTLHYTVLLQPLLSLPLLCRPVFPGSCISALRLAFFVFDEETTASRTRLGRGLALDANVHFG